nr:hypothetical protein Iba_chr02aCG9650 [Ipomoea batatas]
MSSFWSETKKGSFESPGSGRRRRTNAAVKRDGEGGNRSPVVVGVAQMRDIEEAVGGEAGFPAILWKKAATGSWAIKGDADGFSAVSTLGIVRCSSSLGSAVSRSNSTTPLSSDSSSSSAGILVSPPLVLHPHMTPPASVASPLPSASSQPTSSNLSPSTPSAASSEPVEVPVPDPVGDVSAGPQVDESSVGSIVSVPDSIAAPRPKRNRKIF